MRSPGPSAGLSLGLLLLAAFLKAVTASTDEPQGLGGVAAEVVTQHNDNDRTGANLKETVLTPENVTPDGFGKLYDLEVDGQIYAQPLVVAGLDFRGTRRNVVVVATAHNSIYLFDADTGERLWREGFGPPARTPNAYWPIFWYDAPYHDLAPEIGITSTPVFDRATNTLYFTAYTEEPARGRPLWRYWLHALDLTRPSKEDRFGGPVLIQGSGALALDAAYGVGRHYVHDTGGPPTVFFDAAQQLQRPGLLLAKGRVVLGFGAHADALPYQGWVFSYDARDLRKTPGVWISAERAFGGIWQSGMGLTTDDQGYVYLMTGNGFADGESDFGDSVIKLELDGDRVVLRDYFTPCNQNCLRTGDMDLGSSGLLHLPGTRLLVGGGKQGRLYLLDGSNLRGKPLNPGADCTSCQDDVPQRFQASCGAHIHGAPVYWTSAKRGAVVYVWAEDDYLRAFPFDSKSNRFLTKGCQAPAPPWTVGKAKAPQLNSGMTGGMLSISASGDRSGVVWATTPFSADANPRTVPGILRAYDAEDLTRELWNSHQVLERDDLGNVAKFTPPTIANGKVYVATFSRRLAVYGLNPPRAGTTPRSLLVDGGFEAPADPGWSTDSSGGPFRVETSVRFPCQAPYRGKAYGALYPTEDREAGVHQTLTAPEEGTYRLVAYCATNVVRDYVADPSQAGVELGIGVDGQREVERRVVEAHAGYLRYSLRFAARRGSRITVWYRAPRLDWRDASCLVRDRCSCYPEPVCKFDVMRPDLSCKQNPHGGWAAIDAVSLVREE